MFFPIFIRYLAFVLVSVLVWTVIPLKSLRTNASRWRADSSRFIEEFRENEMVREAGVEPTTFGSGGGPDA